ncbi:hypothetical protein CLAFUW4_09072 [Fulvia fulva]|uniref:SLA1 homology domain-containing protein n=1 Tax=Passalora fulva TaxID=5499 RepID=A0A9Q8UTI6_PASFU|nr:uncharacterized protein CLAFUR5_09182 [Fulvia fulva]KAK4613903.1 hypothetical protein CLAFUR4_09078 [Fulvia fulva]KAK4615176.1 hypothetical protein CLAFUR0_09070 [Fulvia fulva]UJO21848.1 hypothetical protein CLAFUR5_09182 [Fulvia fulva]WPV20555.1 hypothetical protein CLAFUW4_09072 [Fulvia fulva]WPV34851.1 hypothetical protein CLAFUW7_09073 [Fulvia fulva]
MTINKPGPPPHAACDTTMHTDVPSSHYISASETEDSIHTVSEYDSADESDAACDTPPETPPASPKLPRAAPQDLKEYPIRTWQDSTGYFRVEGCFVELRGGKSHIQKDDGTILALPIDKLAAQDGEYIESITSGQPVRSNLSEPVVGKATLPSASTLPTAPDGPLQASVEGSVLPVLPCASTMLLITVSRLLMLGTVGIAALLIFGPQNISYVDSCLQRLADLRHMSIILKVFFPSFAALALILGETDLLKSLANIRTQHRDLKDKRLYKTAPSAYTMESTLCQTLISSFLMRYFVGIWVAVIMLVVSVEILSMHSRGVLKQTLTQSIDFITKTSLSLGAFVARHSRAASRKIYSISKRTPALLYFILALVIAGLAMFAKGIMAGQRGSARGHTTTTDTRSISGGYGKDSTTVSTQAAAKTATNVKAVVGAKIASTAWIALDAKTVETVGPAVAPKIVGTVRTAADAKTVWDVWAVAGALTAWTATTALVAVVFEASPMPLDSVLERF